MLNDLLNKKAVILSLTASTKAAALKEIADHLFKNKFVTSANQFLTDLTAREKQFSTGVGDEIAIPHSQSSAVVKNVVLIAKCNTPIEWEALDHRPVKYIFAIALNADDKDKQVTTLQELSKALLNPQTKRNLKHATTINDLLTALVIKETLQPTEVAPNSQRLVAVTACPTGIAHTYMAAEKLQEAARARGMLVKVETQGRRIVDKLSQSEIDAADIIILAIDKGIEYLSRFNNKKVLKVATNDAIKDADSLITRALGGEGTIIKAAPTLGELTGASDDYSWSTFKNVYKNLMGGVSRMLPFVVAGGILIGIAFLLDSGNSGSNLGATRDVAAWFAGLGKVAFGIFVPILGAYVAYSIVGAEGLMPGMVAGLIASGGGILYSSTLQSGYADMWGRLTPGIDQTILSAGSGFIGAMVGGYLAAVSVVVMRRYVFFKVHKNFRGIVDIVAMPLATITITGAMMFCFQIPLAYFAYALKLALDQMQAHNLTVLMTMILAGMMAVDMGGPVNKVAYVFGTTLIAQPTVTQVDYIAMGAVMAGGMVPPLGIAFSALVFRHRAFSKTEIESAKANWLLGLAFITEGAIPFAAKDPKRIIPAIIVGSIVTGLLVGLFKIGVGAPHGGIIVAALYKSYIFTATGAQIGFGITFLIASLAAGMIASGLIMGFWRAHAVKRGKFVLA